LRGYELAPYLDDEEEEEDTTAVAYKMNTAGAWIIIFKAHISTFQACICLQQARFLGLGHYAVNLNNTDCGPARMCDVFLPFY